MMRNLYILLFCVFISNTSIAEQCAYVPKATPDNPYPELTPDTDCGNRINPYSLKVDKALLARLYFNQDGLATVRFRNAIFYVTETGKAVSTIYFDNGPDYFVEGLARTRKDGKIGFIDKKLDIVIEPAFDFAFPFENGKATVCNGCKPQSDGEHKMMVGGYWGEINTAGEIITPLIAKPVHTRP